MIPLQRVLIRSFHIAAVLGLAVFATIAQAAGSAAKVVEPRVVTHAAFFSEETKQPHAIDPQVFVRDAAGKAGSGPQNIVHVEGYRPALVSDPPDTPLYNAKGAPLKGLTLGKWLAASGEVKITPLASGGARIVSHYSGLRPQGVYSLFENHFDQQPIGFTPLDGTGARNSFVAVRDGSGKLTVNAPKMPTEVNAVLLVYHSDGRSHGSSRGEIGVNAHHQLIAKIP